MDPTNTIENYILSHSEPESEVLSELRRMTNLRVMRPRMLSGNIQGQFLKMLCKISGAKKVLEIGTYTGYAAISMAEALPEGGKLYTIDINDELEDMVCKYIDKSGYGDKINFLIGDACDIIPGLDEVFDLVFIDADKRQYVDYYNLIFDKVRTNGLIIADDVLWDGKVVSEKESKDPQTQGVIAFNELVKSDLRVEKIMLPIRHGLFLLRKK
ncbi:class I SAM-dependent methyltransferase [Porphyromonadaceae bacterium OttesenSCG-928-L07]|nr:class I SAM-dependent methyltransferase [Porphyromonadaceae bacterium OttesenSCG-928-L07]MDL2251259.1 class I SAM-dependent methyltransferase [Odoribacter sp. OttesenSCG-928-J03]